MDEQEFLKRLIAIIEAGDHEDKVEILEILANTKVKFDKSTTYTRLKDKDKKSINTQDKIKIFLMQIEENRIGFKRDDIYTNRLLYMTHTEEGRIVLDEDGNIIDKKIEFNIVKTKNVYNHDRCSVMAYAYFTWSEDSARNGARWKKVKDGFDDAISRKVENSIRVSQGITSSMSQYDMDDFEDFYLNNDDY